MGKFRDTIENILKGVNSKAINEKELIKNPSLDIYTEVFKKHNLLKSVISNKNLYISSKYPLLDNTVIENTFNTFTNGNIFHINNLFFQTNTDIQYSVLYEFFKAINKINYYNMNYNFSIVCNLYNKKINIEFENKEDLNAFYVWNSDIYTLFPNNAAIDGLLYEQLKSENIVDFKNLKLIYPGAKKTFTLHIHNN